MSKQSKSGVIIANEKVEILISDVQIERTGIKKAVIGVKVKWHKADGQVVNWDKVYMLMLNEIHTLESFNKKLHDDIRSDILIENRVGEVLHQEGKPYNLTITL